MTLSRTPFAPTSLASVAAGLAGVCRVAVLATLMLVFSGSVLGVTISLHMAQVFNRVTNMHPGTTPFMANDRMLLVQTSL